MPVKTNAKGKGEKLVRPKCRGEGCDLAHAHPFRRGRGRGRDRGTDKGIGNDRGKGKGIGKDRARAGARV
jgi:hypothetical protein